MIKGERMFKLIKRLIFFIILILFLIFGLFVYKGYDMYKQAIEEMSIEEKIAEIKAEKINLKNFLKII